MVPAGGLLMSRLGGGCRSVTLVRGCLFPGARAGSDSPRTAVVADTIHGVVDHGLVVNIVNVRDVHIVHRAVVIEGTVIPISALIAAAAVAKAVVDAPVEADMRTPVADIPGV